MADIRSAVVRALEAQFRDEGQEVPELTDSTVLLESGLDSLGFAVLVTVLEEELGYDPFSLMEQATYPRTLGDFVRVYEENRP